ncbi:MAG: molybdopterin molybdotransferase MoeA [Dehalococcoidales bacterium]|nr:molybdopterin molybdotransferase MoeA [Dehalococcoidales bacterium]
MISVEEALEKILSYVSVLPAETKPIMETLGQTLAEDVNSNFNIPPADNSAMDGYAVRWEDTQGASEGNPIRLRVIDEVPAGYITKKAVTPGTAVRIMTGAAIPEGANAVVQFEHTDEGKGLQGKPKVEKRDEVLVLVPVELGQNIRRAGEDIRQGELILRKGAVIRPAEIGVLASLGRAQIGVVRRPRIAVLATGDELMEVEEPLQPGKIYNSNTYSVSSLILKHGGIPIILGIARDREADLVAKIKQAMQADMLVTTAGVSVGDYDMTKKVLATEGEITFWLVRMKPGKPLAFGRIGGVPHLGLPGNPVSSMVAFEQFGRPAILKMLGRTNFRKPEVEAILHGSADNRDGRRCFYRAHVNKQDGQWHAYLTGPQGSGILTSMALANGLVIVPEDTKLVNDGEAVRVQMLDWPEECF